MGVKNETTKKHQAISEEKLTEMVNSSQGQAQGQAQAHDEELTVTHTMPKQRPPSRRFGSKSNTVNGFQLDI
jgi:hypothetical protein